MVRVNWLFARLVHFSQAAHDSVLHDCPILEFGIGVHWILCTVHPGDQVNIEGTFKEADKVD